MRASVVAALLVLALPGVPRAGGPATPSPKPEETGEEELESVLEGFESPPPEPSEETTARRGWRRWVELHGTLALGLTDNLIPHHDVAGTRWGGLSRLRPKLTLEGKLRLPAGWEVRASGYGFYDLAYRARNRDDFRDDVLDDYEWDLELQELYLQGTPLPHVDVRLGRQIVNWGRSDTLRVLDVLNPLDNREPLLVDLPDLRRGVTMVRIDLYEGPWTLSLIGVPEVRLDRNPPLGSDFFPDFDLSALAAAFGARFGIAPEVLLAAFPEGLDVHDETPARWPRRPEWGASLGGTFHGWDLTLYAAQTYEDTGRLFLFPSSQPVSLPGLGTLTLDLFDVELRHSRVTLAGLGADLTWRSWLLKAEAAHLSGFEYTVLDDLGPPSRIAHLTRSRIDAMVGVEYYGLTDTTVGLEVVGRYLLRFAPELRGFPNYGQRSQLEVALRISRDWLDQRLHLTLLGVALGSGGQNGAIARISAEYELTDAWRIGGGLLLFESGRLPYTASIGRNDRAFLNVEYHF